ncbi:MAG: family 78 glycoside hydrolase catalytic domain [Bacteroidota bacterium]|nr:family 78 glycoside hydrolase catalytic domain [Bacteroidota bacterium]
MRKLILTLFCLSFIISKAQDIIHPLGLTTENLTNPEGIDITSPRLSWISTSTGKAQLQTAYQIGAASSLDNVNKNNFDLWDSGKQMSDQSTYIKYSGKELVSESKVFWKVKVWDKTGKESEWSPVSTFTIGLISPNDWKAKWIGLDKTMPNERPSSIIPLVAGRMLRKESAITKTVKSATLYVSAAGLYEFYINGNRVGDAVLAPALSQMEKRVFYNTYDVSKLIKTGKNAFGSYLGAGRYTSLRPLQEATGEWSTTKYKPTDTLPGYKPRYPKLLAQMNITYTDGSKESIITDNTWKITTNGPITRNNEYDGESYDATKEQTGWDKPGFNDAQWLTAQLVESPSPLICSENKQPIKVMETLKPISVKELKPGVFIVDMGQNMVGWAKLKVKGSKGSTVKMVFSELLKPDGSLYLDNMRTAEVTDYYTLKGDPNGESLEPKFTYHGFRYVEISGFPGKPDLNSIEGKVVHDALPVVGSFSCSNDIMTQLHKNAYWGIRGNYRSMPTDCPQRDERFGWLGDRSVEAKGEAYIFRNVTLHNKWMQDINDATLDNGSVPDVAPTHNGMVKIYNDGVVWPSCFIIIPNVIYQQTGDSKLIERNYDQMVKWAKYMRTFMSNGLIGKNTYGDWCMPPERLDIIWSQDPKRQTSGVLMSSCYLYYDFKLIASYAKMLGKSEDVTYFENEAANIRKAINDILFNRGSFLYDNNSLSSSLLPIGMGVVGEDFKEKVFQNTIQKLVVEHQTKMGTGLIGGQWLMKTLTDNGRPDLAYTLATNTDYPSWGYQIVRGATTIWELWNGDKARPDMNSGNHVMLLGDVIIWMYESVGGIANANKSVGFKKIKMRPELSDKVKFAKASHISLYGNISSEWRTEGKNFIWNIEIPVNTSATVEIPAVDESVVVANGVPAHKSEGVKFVKLENGRAVYEVGSGKYAFVSTNFVFPEYKTYVFSPSITPNDTLLVGKSVKVTIKSNTPNAKIYYTTNGATPTEQSKLYTGPFDLIYSSTVRAIASLPGKSPSFESNVNIELINNTNTGWAYNYYEGEWKKLPDFSTLKPLTTGTSAIIDLKALSKRPDNYGIVLKSNLQIDNAGEYTFYTTSDDGSRIKIDGKEVAVIDGTHGPETAFGKVNLTEGKHTIEVEYFEAVGGESLELQWQYNNGTKTKLPVSKLNFVK